MKNITLEMSLKPFKKIDKEYIEEVCSKIFEQWKPLVKGAETVSVLLWSADGSELFDYSGNMDDEFEWGKYVGAANVGERDYNIVPKEIDPEGISTYLRCYEYIDNPPQMTYKKLAEIVDAIKRVGKAALPQKKIRVGTTIDPGPEFAKSSFKYQRHNEVCRGGGQGNCKFICAYDSLKGDSWHYASYPNGIPDGTPFGTFLGKQTAVFVKDMGFDYLWISNGLGFGPEPWSPKGPLFDGESFNGEEIEGVKDEVLSFWKYFREECPDFPVEVRGTNMSAGIDFATDGIPLREIYDKFSILPPPNSPWAAIDGDFGLELMGYMSRISYLPDDRYLFRYYLHDPWWMNSPWYDRYNGQPHDIYMPLAVSRIDEEGNIGCPTHMNILSVDNSMGDMPESCVNETIPHFLKAFKEMPDSVAPVVWIYPFDEYMNAKTEKQLNEMFFADWFIRGAINNGLPLASVTTTTAFAKQDKSIYRGSVLISYVPEADSEYEKQIINYAKNGGRVIFFGDTIRAGADFLDLCGIENGMPVSGELDISVEGKLCGIIKHSELICGGGIGQKALRDNEFVNIGGRCAGICEKNFIWLRGTVSADYRNGVRLPMVHNEKEYFIGEKLLCGAVGMLGLETVFEKQVGVKSPVIMWHRYDNAYIFSSYHPSTTVKTKMKFRFGAPILDGYETIIDNGYSTYHFPKAEHRECRVFVEQNDGTVQCKELPPGSFQMRRRIKVSGLKNATVRFLGEEYCKENLYVVKNCKSTFYLDSEPIEGGYVNIDGIMFYEARNVSGEMVFSMPFEREIKNN